MKHNFSNDIFEDRIINIYTVPQDFMDAMARRISLMEKQVRRNSRRAGFLLGVCVALGYDIYQIRKTLIRETMKKEEKPGD